MAKIVAHRGAKGLALENTLEAFRLAKRLGADMLEFDVRCTKDGQPVVCHDDRLLRVSDSSAAISELTFDELRAIRLHNGETVPHLRDVLAVAGTTPVVIEIKVSGCTKTICQVADGFPHARITFASFRHDVVAECHRLRPHAPVFVAESSHPLAVIAAARALGAAGIDLNYHILNPLTYLLARRAGLQLMVYTVNNRFAVRLIHRFYPHVWVCTNHPERFLIANAAHEAPRGA